MKTDKDKADILERFTNELWPINKQGNAEHAASEVIRMIGQYTFDGDLITFDLIKERYKAYIRYMDIINADRDPRFYTKAETLAKWLVNKKYDEDFSLATNETLDQYLYGD